MPTFNFGFNDASAEISEGFEEWKGPLPPNGTYKAKLKLAKIVPMKSDKTKKRIMILAEVDAPGEGYDKYPAFGGVNLTDQGIPYVNQFLRALVPSDTAFEKIHKVFFGKGPVVDTKKENILKIGDVKVNSPEGEFPILVQLKQEPYNGKTNAKIQAFLPPSGGSSGSSGTEDEAIEEESAEPESDGLEEDSGEDESSEDEAEDTGEVGEEIFEEAEEEGTT